MAVVQFKQAPDGGRVLHTQHPGTLAPTGSIPVDGPAEVAAAMARARAAQPAWAALGFKGRRAAMERALTHLLDHTEDFIDVIVQDTGRSRFEARFLEILPACDALRFFGKFAAKALKTRRVGMHLLRHKSLRLEYRPRGVIGVITPWNGPFILGVSPTVQALMAGNAVIVKPSEITPHAGALVARLFAESGLDERLVQVVQGDGATGAALIDGGVDMISFTGSVATGRKVGEACGRNLIPATLELGGKDAMIVCGDADVDRAAGGCVFGSMVITGQFCCSTERVYVVEAVHDRFVDAVVEKVAALRTGTEGEFDIGAIIRADQLDIIERQVADAVAKGATVAVGGHRVTDHGGNFYAPTVITGATHDMLVMTEETFGPVVAIMKVADEAEAVRLANDTSYGLSGTVWSKDRKRAVRLAEQLDTGSVCVNDSCVTYGALEAPFGGARNSGVGVTHGVDGMRSYCLPRPILVDRIAPTEEMVWFPYQAAKEDKIKKAIAFLWKNPLGRLLS